jgi:hypothetical protein
VFLAEDVPAGTVQDKVQVLLHALYRGSLVLWKVADREKRVDLKLPKKMDPAAIVGAVQFPVRVLA